MTQVQMKNESAQKYILYFLSV